MKNLIYVDIVRYLVSELGCSTVCQNENGDIPLLEACAIQRVGTHMVIHYCMRLVMRVMWTLYGSILVNGGAVQPVRTGMVILHCLRLVGMGI